MLKEKLDAFDESANNVVNINGHEQPPVDEDYLKSLMIPNGIDFAEYAQTRDSEKDNIKSPMHYLDEIKKSLKVNLIEGDTLPWTKTHDNLRFRPSEVTLWHGYSGHKKSMVLGYAAMNFAYSGHPVCIASFEMKPVKTLMRLLKQASGTVTPTEYALDNFANHFDNKLWIYDKMGNADLKALFGVMYYCADKLGVKHFVIDSLMRVVPSEDDYNAQKNFIVQVCAIANETNMHIHIVHHNRKGDESHAAGSQGAKGTGAIKDNVHNAIEVWTKYKDLEARQKDNEFDAPDVYLLCTKQREGEWEGNIGLWFDEGSLQFKGSKDAGVRTWLK